MILAATPACHWVTEGRKKGAGSRPPLSQGLIKEGSS
jgi:hypothetical protein